MITKSRKSTINAFLDISDASSSEREEVVNRLANTKLKKITKNRVSKILKDMRFNRKITAIKNELGVILVKDFSMRFDYIHIFDIEGYETFNKRVEIKVTEAYNKSLVHDKFQLFLEAIRIKKADAIENKKREIHNFIESVIGQTHSYLDRDEIYNIISLAPLDTPYHMVVPLPLIERLFGSDGIRLKKSKANIIASRDLYFKLYGVDISYTLTLITKKVEIYESIWRGESLDFHSPLEKMNKNARERFSRNIKTIESQLIKLSQDFELEKSDIESYILEFVQSEIEPFGQLIIGYHDREAFIYRFGQYIERIIEQKKKEELLAKSIRNFKNLFPLARSLNRKIIFHKGSTNSGKTYQALKYLKEAETGCYLAPLRLLALEVYENLKDDGVAISLITGEEQILDEDSTHISSTIEMMNSSVELDVAVIDEIQMIDDHARGWAWTNALIGTPAKTVILTGSDNALKIVQKLSAYLEEPLEVVDFERMNPLELLSEPTHMVEIEESTAVITFSRGEVLELRKQLLKDFDVSVIYGALSPEVRREEARRFREGESQILVATDAIAMGLNLPIKTILFARDNKFDGVSERLLTPAEVTQISGRAGRYGIQERGFVGALNTNILKTVSKAFNTPLKEITLPLSVMANFEHIMLIGDILETNDIVRILKFFAKNMVFDTPFKTTKIDSMLEVAHMVNRYTFDLQTKFTLTIAPVSTSSYYIKPIFEGYLYNLEKKQEIKYNPPTNLVKIATSNEMMQRAEEQIREISLYLWLSFKFPEQFIDSQKAIKSRAVLNRFIANSLREGEFEKRCRECGEEMELSYRFAICERCYYMLF